MTYKYAAAGVNLGGGKAVIIGDPTTQKTEALMRAMGRTTLNDMELLYQETEHVITLPEYCRSAGNIGPATAFGVQQAMKACVHAVWGSSRWSWPTSTRPRSNAPGASPTRGASTASGRGATSPASGSG